jgi:threonine dehydrogenase-like Zn-dependent dehydrogenase
MKKKVLMSLVLLAIIGAGAVFAQSPTPEKLAFTAISGGTAWAVSALNTSISGDVVIPASHEGKPVTAIREWLGNGKGAFENCRNITSVLIPYSVTTIARGAFYNCTSLRSAAVGNGVALIDYHAFRFCAALTSVTFGGTVSNINTTEPFPGDLRDKVLAAGAGTYTRPSGSNTWTKQDAVCPLCGKPL